MKCFWGRVLLCGWWYVVLDLLVVIVVFVSGDGGLGGKVVESDENKGGEKVGYLYSNRIRVMNKTVSTALNGPEAGP